MSKYSDIFKSVIKENKIEKARQVGATKVAKDGTTRYWTEIAPGKFDWRKTPPGSAKSDDSSDDKKVPMSGDDKLKNHLKNTDEKSLRAYANKPGNAPKLRKLAYDELKSRGVDVSDIDLNTGRVKTMKEAFGVNLDGEEEVDEDSVDAVDFSTDDEYEVENDWEDFEKIKKKFGGLKTRAQRIAADAFIYSNKIKQDDYKPPQKVIHSLNKSYSLFFQSELPLLIVSGGAGVGKSHNLHLVAQVLGKRPFDSSSDEPGDGDYDYFEAPEVNSDSQLIQVLKEHNGKTIVFDDSDNILTKPEALGIMKKATATSGKRIIGRKSTNAKDNVDPFEFTGKIIFLTNKDQQDLTKNEHVKAIFSRAQKQNINFTKKEMFEMIKNLRHKMEFTGLPRLKNKADDIAERDEVFKLLEENISKMDPQKFTPRIFSEAIAEKRKIEDANEMIKNNPLGADIFGEVEDWIPEVEKMLIKGLTSEDLEQERLEKALSHFDLLK
jgi:hypothetical protein